MQAEDRDAAYLWDILQACQDILDFTQNKTLYDFEQDKILRYAVERQILVIGEAAKNVSDTLKQKTPHIPWKLIIAQRNIIAHEYGEILTERIWKVTRQRIPELSEQIQELVPESPESEETAP